MPGVLLKRGNLGRDVHPGRGRVNMKTDVYKPRRGMWNRFFDVASERTSPADTLILDF